MKEDLFKEMMTRWGVTPSKKHKHHEPVLPPPQPQEPVKASVPEPAPAWESELDSDERMFQRAMNNIDVLDIHDGLSSRKSNRELYPSKAVLPEEERNLFLEALAEMDGIAPKEVDLGEKKEQALRKQRFQKREELSLGATLDLHGLTTNEALSRLTRFVSANFVKSVSNVMVITGKGKHSNGGVAVLRPTVENWILTRGKRFVASYGEAPRAYGGRGAFILYLRKS